MYVLKCGLEMISRMIALYLFFYIYNAAVFSKFVYMYIVSCLKKKCTPWCCQRQIFNSSGLFMNLLPLIEDGLGERCSKKYILSLLAFYGFGLSSG